MKKVILIVGIFAFFAILNTANAQNARHGEGFGISAGVARIAPTGNLSNFFTPTAGFNISADFRFTGLYLGGQIEIVPMRLSRPLLTSTDEDAQVFQTGHRFNYNSLALVVGYNFVQRSRFVVMPFAGVGGGDVSRYNEFSIISFLSISPGLRIELPLIHFGGDFGGNHLNLRFDIGYNIPVYAIDNSPVVAGNFFFIRTNIAWW